MGASRPFFLRKANQMADVYEQERTLQNEIAQQLQNELPEVEVLAVELLSPKRFCVYVDRPGGVDHELCARVTNQLRNYLDRYTVDVSSPGLERPLRKPSHFADAVGRKVALRTAAEIEGRKKFRGELVSVGDQAVTVAAGEQRVDIPYETIVRGNLIDEGAGR
jgi:ribosome maturation factor RimP